MYEYVTKKEVALVRDEIESIIHKVQNDLRKNNIMTFQYQLIGSASKRRHLVTRIIGGNQGFDMDYNLIIQSFDEDYNDAKKMKHILMETFNKFLQGKFEYCEDSKSVFTIKKVDKKNSKIVYSFDFAIVYYSNEDIKNPDYDEDYNDPEDEYYEVETQKYIYFDKYNSKKYSWVTRDIICFDDHRHKEKCIKEYGFWNELRDLYLKQKNLYPKEKSRIIYYDTVDKVYQKHFN